jgi:hypothetical protein
MSAPRFHLPSVEHLVELGVRHEHAITVYADTSPAPDRRSDCVVTVKSAVDQALRTFREGGARHAVEEDLRAQWEQIASQDFWHNLSRSVAVFIADEFHEVYVLPNELEHEVQVGNYFDIGQLVRAVTAPQEAYGLTLSSNKWHLWRATPTTRAEIMTLVDKHPANAAEASHHHPVRSRKAIQRLVGDEGKKVLDEAYARRIAAAVESELARVDPFAQRPLFLFATEPLLDMYRSFDHKRHIVPVHGACDELHDYQIDEAMRPALAKINSEINSAHVNKIGNELSRGLVATDVVDIARAAVAGAVRTVLYDFTVDVLGYFDDVTGNVTYDDGGYELLSRIVVAVLEHGGEAIAVRREEISAPIWNGAAVAELRFPLSS